MSIFESLNRWSDRGVLIRAFALLVVVGFTDYATGWELSLFVFYAVPIFMVGYRMRRSVAWGFAAASTFVWYLVNYGSHPYKSQFAFAWVTVSRGVYMAFVAYAAALLRRYQDAEHDRLEAVERESQMRQSLLREIEGQQRNFGRELHDGVCQLLSGTALACESLASRLEHMAPDESRAAREIEGYVRKASAEARDLARGLFPVQMGSEGLPAALEQLALRTDHMAEGMRVSFSQNGPTRPLDPEAAMHLYRIAQEALSNAVRHSGGKTVTVSLSLHGDGIRMEVADDGSGFAPEAHGGPGIGLATMSYRAAQIGARLDVLPRAPRGTRVVCLLSEATGANTAKKQSRP
jgi:signal transduction histidine kinase